MSNPNWYERGREVLRSWAATSATATEAARMAPLGRALDVVDAGDVLVNVIDDNHSCLSDACGVCKAIAAYRAARGAR